MPEETLLKDTIIVKTGYRHFEPIYVSVKATIKYIFPVPQPNAVGTLDGYSNGIVYIGFGGKPKTRVIARNFSKEVFGEFTYRFSPNFSDDIIVYSKTRVAVIVNVKTGEAFHADFDLTFDDFMHGIRFLDPQNNVFVVVKTIGRGVDFYSPRIDNLHLAKLDGKQLVDLGQIMPHFGERRSITSDASMYVYNNWLIHNRTLIAYDAFNSRNMLCFNGLTEIRHPFTDVFNSNKDKVGSVRGFAIHPELPFGIVVDDTRPTHPLLFLRWNTNDPDEQFTTINHKLLPLAALFNIKAEY
ncbi:MAG: hypothetical protein FWB85_09940, partial [Chitinispirillia bacterium]|nr:hypothetical protein [Chitinispirillia bacterium]